MTVQINGTGSVQGTQGYQIGTSGTATQNFTWQVPTSPNGTLKLARGNINATTSDIITVDASGVVSTGTLTLGTPLAVASGGTGDSGTAWTQVTAVFAPLTGGFGDASGLYWWKRIGKTVFINASLTITSNGTAGGSVRLNLPFSCINGAVLIGREDAVTGLMVQGVIKPTESVCSIFTYANNYPGVNGAVLRINGTYETAAA